MVRPCCFVSCLCRVRHRRQGITFHEFPTCEEIRTKWVAVVRLDRQEPRWTPSPDSRVCSLHFPRSQFLSKRVLHSRAVPIRKYVVPKFMLPGNGAEGQQEEQVEEIDLTDLSNDIPDDDVLPIFDETGELKVEEEMGETSAQAQKKQTAALEEDDIIKKAEEKDVSKPQIENNKADTGETESEITAEAGEGHAGDAGKVIDKTRPEKAKEADIAGDLTDVKCKEIIPEIYPMAGENDDVVAEHEEVMEVACEKVTAGKEQDPQLGEKNSKQNDEVIILDDDDIAEKTASDEGGTKAEKDIEMNVKEEKEATPLPAISAGEEPTPAPI